VIHPESGVGSAGPASTTRGAAARGGAAGPSWRDRSLPQRPARPLRRRRIFACRRQTLLQKAAGRGHAQARQPQGHRRKAGLNDSLMTSFGGIFPRFSRGSAATGAGGAAFFFGRLRFDRRRSATGSFDGLRRCGPGASFFCSGFLPLRFKHPNIRFAVLSRSRSAGSGRGGGCFGSALMDHRTVRGFSSRLAS